MNLDHISERMTSAFLKGKGYARAQKDGYSDFAYPRLLKLMRFHTERY